MIALLACVWVVGSLVWGAVVYLACLCAPMRQFENWPSYWLAWLAAAALPPLVAPLIALAPLPVLTPQLDIALSLANWTEPLQRDHDANGGALAQVAALVIISVVIAGVARGLWILTASFARAHKVAHTARPFAMDLAPDEQVRLLVSAQDTQTFCIGGVCPAIVLPQSALAQMSDEQVRMMIRHECAHVRRHDPRLFAALALLDVLYWFNPFIGRLTSQTRLAAEIACDSIALERAGSARAAYADALVRALEQSDVSSAVAAFGRRSDMPRIRLSYILRGGGPRRSRNMSALIVIASVGLCLSTTGVAASTARLAVFGDPKLLSALEARVDGLYGGARCPTIASAETHEQAD